MVRWYVPFGSRKNELNGDDIKKIKGFNWPNKLLEKQTQEVSLKVDEIFCRMFA